MTKEIPLTRGKVAIVDDEDYDFLMQTSWCCLNKGYAFRKRKKVPELMHRIVMNAKEGEFVDHINRDKLDNRKSNLRIVTFSENLANKPLQKNNTSGYKGVSFHKSTGKWCAYIGSSRGNSSVNLGTFINKEDAARAYNKAAIQLYGDCALLNDVSEEADK
jgi:hypothetical protein